MVEGFYMIIKSYDPKAPKSSEITPEFEYINRRRFFGRAGAMVAAATLAACAPRLVSGVEPLPIDSLADASVYIDELGNKATSFTNVTNYNNYYEFSTDKEAVAKLSSGFVTDPWTIEVSGLVNNPMTLGLEDFQKKYTQSERIYRHRCVEGWSMVIPWSGFSLSDLLKKVEPTSAAKYVSFETVFRPDAMVGQTSNFYPWPYTEGLRMDEAMNDLTTLATGIYGKNLLPQNGAPIRLVVPWKYGFKSIKSIVKITLTDVEPQTFWDTIAPDLYGFYSNVNPGQQNSIRSQVTERRIGDNPRVPTLLYNGYDPKVGSLYTGMDLNTYY
jgi:sulfoxide reductase catalytic subunit YedY